MDNLVLMKYLEEFEVQDIHRFFIFTERFFFFLGWFLNKNQ